MRNPLLTPDLGLDAEPPPEKPNPRFTFWCLAMWFAFFAFLHGGMLRPVAVALSGLAIGCCAAYEVWLVVAHRRYREARDAANAEFERMKCERCSGSGIDPDGDTPLANCRSCDGKGVQALRAVRS